ncbi:MAG TPA: glutathione S-transferase family protein [Gammaproteobacteria bacterium]|nr:glutathione S-transferase family protein [Gammaproteobacteria bacterium]
MNTAPRPVKLFQFPRMFGIPNVSPFCCKLETWLRIAGIPFEVVDTPDPRKGPKGKVPFIEDNGVRIGDSSLIVDHFKKTRGVDPDARLDASERATALLVQRTLEEHYSFVILYTHFMRPEGWRHMRAQFDFLPAVVRPLVLRSVRGRMKKLLWLQGLLRHSDADIIESGLRDWRSVLTVLDDKPFLFGGEPTGTDATVFGALATSMFTPVQSPIRDYLWSQPAFVAFADNMFSRFFPELPRTPTKARGSGLAA